MGYSSKYSGSFDLTDTIKYPKMCADLSLNLTNGVKYYRGRNELPYYVGQQSKGASARLGDDATWLFQNGTNAQGLLGRFDPNVRSGTFYVQTDSQKAEGNQRTILRGCSSYGELSELYLHVNVEKNTYPDFEKEIETSWNLNRGETLKYRLPKLVDEEKNDIPELYINAMADQEYPPFLSYENSTQTLIFKPDSIWHQGKTFYFRIIVKEKNSDTVLYPYYCNVKVQGIKVDPEEYLNFTDISFDMGTIDRYGRGTLKWSQPVNLTFVREYWNDIFDVYVKNVTFRDHNTTMPLK